MFGWLFRGSGLPEPAVIEWLFDTYRWLLRESGGFGRFRRRTTLILPGAPFFAVDPKLRGHARAVALFELTRANAGLDDWPCRLEALDEGSRELDLYLSGKSHGAAGTFRRDRRGAVISYAPSAVADEQGFIATMAHELGHYYNGDFRAPPGGEEGYEPATDITAVFLGFDLFMVNRTFHASDRGTSQLGYLDEKVLSYALAIFLELHELPAPVKHLKTNPRAYIKDAFHDLRKRRALRLERLRAIGPG